MSMKKITYFHIKTCPYCIHANRAIEELINENAVYGEIEIERIAEEDNPDIVVNYDYYYVPCMYFGDVKVYEADPSQGYEEIKAEVKRVFDMAVAEQ